MIVAADSKIIYILLSFYQMCITSSQRICVNENGVCELELTPQQIFIDQTVLETCPTECKKISVSAFDSGVRTVLPEAFLSFNSLTSLSIKANLSSQTAYEWILGLRSLTLSSCGLINVDSLALLNGSQTLTAIDLSNNNLEHLPLNFFNSLPLLSILDLSSNTIKTIPHLTDPRVFVNVSNNPLVCTCSNAYLNRAANVHTSNFICQVNPCKYFLSFDESGQNRTVVAFGAEPFLISCNVNSSDNASFGVYSPIGFIPGPTWQDPTARSMFSTYQYTMMFLQKPIKLTFVKLSENSATLTVHYARGHHGGEWRCAALSGGSLIVDKQSILVVIETPFFDVFERTTVFGIIVMVCALFLAIFVGSLRYLIETRCFKQRQSHRYVGVPLIGVIPVPPPEAKYFHSVETISLNQRICPECLSNPSFTCGYCLTAHAFSEFQISSEESISSDDVTPESSGKRRRFTSVCLVEPPPPLIGSDASPNLSTVEIGVDMQSLPELNYDFPSVFCHCSHMDMRFIIENDGETFNLRDVKLVFSNENLAQEYTEALESLQEAANSNDADTFRHRLEEFRARLVKDVGKSVRVVREEIFALKKRSEKSVAYLKDQSGVVAQRMKAGLTHVKDGMRSMAEMCSGAITSAADSAPGPSNAPAETIGQSISVVSIYRDEATNEPKERYVSNFQF